MLRYISVPALVFLLVIGTAPLLRAVEIGSLKDLPAGTVRFSMYNDRDSHHVEISWGGDTEETGSDGPILEFRSETQEKPTLLKLDKGTLERLFEATRKLTANHAVPRSTTANRSNRSHFQLYIGVISDPLRLNFPANEPHLWNRAAGGWKLCAEILKKEASLSLPAATPLPPTKIRAPAPGLASIRDYTSMRLDISRADRSKPDYGTISASWNRAEDGSITFTAGYINRSADSLSATPTAAQIRPLFDHIQKLAKGYRHPSFSRNQKAAGSRSYDSIDVALSPDGQPGEYLLPYFSTDASQWSDADQLWSFLVKLFPEEQQKQIIQ